VRTQYEAHPYPTRPLDMSPVTRVYDYWSHSATGAFYRRDGTLQKTTFKILDVGCGTGVKTLVLQMANPGCQVTGVDVSPSSIGLARQRAAARNMSGIEFRTVAVEDLESLDGRFDYINCDDAVYLFNDPGYGLECMRNVLEERGIMRVTLHNVDQRRRYLRVQALLRMLGVSELPQQEAIAATRRLYRSLRPDALLRQFTWRHPEPTDDVILQNHLLAGDRAYSLDEILELLSSRDLSLAGVVDPLAWECASAFRSGDDQSTTFMAYIQSCTLNDRLRIAEMLIYSGRLFDLYVHRRSCTNKGMSLVDVAVDAGCAIGMHPALELAGLREAVVAAIARHAPLNVGPYITASGHAVWLTGPSLEVLHLAAEQRMTVESVVDTWHSLRPLWTVDRMPKTRTDAAMEVQAALNELTRLGIVWLGDVAPA
jgi:2-polyprenyl-3-methyl-5-hydroxy-6-metoxy-1,4-benzoquinol methylase